MSLRKPQSENIRQDGKVPIPRLYWIAGLTFYSIFLGGSAQRIVPGGPFISVTGDILPVLSCFIVMTLGLTLYRTKNQLANLIAVITTLAACVIITQVATDVMRFWVRPAARGVFIGW